MILTLLAASPLLKMNPHDFFIAALSLCAGVGSVKLNDWYSNRGDDSYSQGEWLSYVLQYCLTPHNRMEFSDCITYGVVRLRWSFLFLACGAGVPCIPNWWTTSLLSHASWLHEEHTWTRSEYTQYMDILELEVSTHNTWTFLNLKWVHTIHRQLEPEVSTHNTQKFLNLEASTSNTWKSMNIPFDYNLPYKVLFIFVLSEQRVRLSFLMFSLIFVKHI